MSNEGGGNDGALFQNQNKEKGDNRPNYTGLITVNGVKYSLAGWKNLSKDNKPYMALKLSEWRDKPDQAPATQTVDSDDIPF